MSASLPWYFARSAGLVAWALLSASVIWGLVMSTKAKVGAHKPRPAWMLDLHRFLGGLACIFTAIHVLAILADGYVNFDPISVLVPFAATWHPLAVAWGIVGLYLLIAVEVTSLLRSKMPRGWWRKVHFASFGLFATATIHALTAGTDTGSWIFELVATGVVLAVASLTALRSYDATRPPVRKVQPWTAPPPPRPTHLSLDQQDPALVGSGAGMPPAEHVA